MRGQDEGAATRSLKRLMNGASGELLVPLVEWTDRRERGGEGGQSAARRVSPPLKDSDSCIDCERQGMPTSSIRYPGVESCHAMRRTHQYSERVLFSDVRGPSYHAHGTSACP